MPLYGNMQGQPGYRKYPVYAARYLSKSRYGFPSLYGAGAGAIGSSIYGYGPGPPPPPSPYGSSKRKGAKKRMRGRQKKDKLKSIQKKLVAMAKVDDSTTGDLIHRNNLCGNIKSLPNAQNILWMGVSNLNQIEATLSYCKFFDPATNSLVVADLSSGTYQRNININNVQLSVKFKNNYRVPCNLVVYLCTTKDDTNIAPDALWSAGVADGSNLTATTQLNQYPTDYNLVNDVWKLRKYTDVILEPGAVQMVKHSGGSFSYDPATTDTHNDAWQKEYKAFGFLVVLKGLLAHDSVVATEQGITPAGVDYEQKVITHVQYSAGANIKYTQVDNVYDTFTNSALVSNKPVAGNQNYSVA